MRAGSNVTLDQLRARDAVYLHALLLQGGSNISMAPGAVAPNESFYWHMLGCLERQGVIVAVTSKARTAAGERYGTASQRHYDVDADLGALPKLKAQLAAHLCALRSDPALPPQYAAIWAELGVAELQAYLEWELASHRFDVRWSENLLPIMEMGLSVFSIGQMFYFCWTAVRDLASHHLRHPAPCDTYQSHLASSMAAKIERATRDGWEVRQYSRQWRRHTNAVSDTFANIATGLGERFLLEVPSSTAITSLF